MKDFVLLAIATCFALTGTTLAEPPIARRAETIAPEDLGMVKYFFEGSPAAGQLLIFRRLLFREGKLEETYDTISNTLGELRRESVLLIDHSFFVPNTKTRFSLRTAQSVSLINGPSRGWQGGNQQVTFEFDSEGGRLKYVFSVFEEDYESVRKRTPSLPEKSEIWTCAFSFKPGE